MYFESPSLPHDEVVSVSLPKLRVADSVFANPLISVALVTYNHAPYVAKALESILQQECRFSVEIVVGDDCSTDETKSIVEVYARRFPDRIRVLERDGNLGSQRNVQATMEACKGEYIAYLDGDDYWTHPHKLQRQVEALREFPESPLVFHNSKMLYEHCKPGMLTPPRGGRQFGLEHILKRNFIAAQSIMIRREAREWMPDWMFTNSAIPWDWPFFIECAKHGQLLHINENMCAYRIHEGGMWSATSSGKRLDILYEMLEQVSLNLDPEYQAILRKTRFKLTTKQKVSQMFPLLLERLQKIRQTFRGH